MHKRVIRAPVSAAGGAPAGRAATRHTGLSADPAMSSRRAEEQHFLPDFGSFGMAIRIIFLALLIAIIITIGRNPVFNEHAWQEFNLLAAFALALSFIVVVVLKLAAPLLKRTSATAGSVLVVLLILAVTAVGTDAMIFALHDLGFVAERWPPWRESLLVRTLMIAGIISVLGLRYLILQHRAELDAKSREEARMQALQSRIRPHFLFNSLNAVLGLMRREPRRAEQVIEDLAELFRALLTDGRSFVRLGDEIALLERYAAIEKLRLGERLRLTWELDAAPVDALLPPLVLQPLLENAVYHGVEPAAGPGEVRVRIERRGERVRAVIENTLVPAPAGAAHGHRHGSGMALANVRERLALFYDAEARLQTSAADGLYRVEIDLPYRSGAA